MSLNVKKFVNSALQDKNVISGLGSLAGQIGYGAFSGDLNSGVGAGINKIGNAIGSVLPGKTGAMVSLGSGLVGGAINSLIGTKWNQQNIENVENETARMNNLEADANSLDALQDTIATTAGMSNFSDSYIGEGGLFAKGKVRDKANKLRDNLQLAFDRQNLTLDTNAQNIMQDTIGNLEANYVAFGGPLYYADGGPIYIKPENRGKFTETKRRTGKTTEELTHSKNPLTRKRAIFAQNAAKWHHSFGGELNTQGGNFTNGLLYIDNGGSHEENPYEGVPMGVDNQGTPNLVEEGETVFNDYVFSKRLKVPKSLRKKYKLRNNITFADASKKLSKESEERPNDPISKRGLEAILNDLTISQEEIRAKKGAAKMQDAIQQEQMMGQPNTFGGGGDTKEKDQTYRENFKPVLSTNYDMINRLSLESPEGIAQDIPLNQYYYVDGQGIKVLTSKKYAPKDKSLYEINNSATSHSDDWTPLDTRLRYLPAWASGIASITDAIGLTNKPDYSNADAVLQAARSAGIYKPVSFNPIGNYLSYNPFDRNYYLNKLNAQAGASRRALLQNAGMNRGAATAALLAADYNNQNQVGQLAQKAEEYNLEQRQKVEQFNRETNSANSSGMLQADTANQQALQNLRQFTLNATATAAELRQKELEAKSTARSLNLSNFINSLGDIGRENFNINMINTDKSKYFRFNKDGTIEYKGGIGNDPFYQALVESYNKNKQKNKQTGLTE